MRLTRYEKNLLLAVAMGVVEVKHRPDLILCLMLGDENVTRAVSLLARKDLVSMHEVGNTLYLTKRGEKHL